MRQIVQSKNYTYIQHHGKRHRNFEDQSEIKKEISEINNSLEGINSRLDEAEDQISDLKDKVGKNIQSEQQNEKRSLKKEESLRNILDNMKQKNIRIMGISGEEREQGVENLFEEIMTENFPNLVKKEVTQVQEAQRLPKKLDPKRPTHSTS